MRKLCAAFGAALLMCSATMTTPAYAFHDPGGAPAATVNYGTIGDTNQATALPDDNVGRVYSSFNIDNLGAVPTRSIAPGAGLVDGSLDTA